MKIHTIHLDDEGMPEELVASVTVAEAAFLARVVGRLPEQKALHVGLRLDTYCELSSLFNRFYDGGLEDFPMPSPDLGGV